MARGREHVWAISGACPRAFKTALLPDQANCPESPNRSASDSWDKDVFDRSAADRKPLICDGGERPLCGSRGVADALALSLRCRETVGCRIHSRYTDDFILRRPRRGDQEGTALDSSCPGWTACTHR